MKLKYYCTIIGALLLFSCNRELMVGKAPDFDVTTTSSTYKVGEEIVFHFTGDADLVSFYSGQESNDFLYKEGRIIDVTGEGATMSFTSAGATVNALLQNNQVSIMASTDFNGKYDFTNVKAANWTDVTNRFTLNGLTTSFVASGVKDISDLVSDPHKPIYIGFKYITKPQEFNGLTRTYLIQSFIISSKAALPPGITKPLTLADQITAAFSIVDQNAIDAPARTTLTTSRITMNGNIYKYAADPIYDPTNPMYDLTNPIYDPSSPLFNPLAKKPTVPVFDPNSPFNDPLSEHWVISGPIYTDKVDFGPDYSIPIKGMTDGKMDRTIFKYSKPGTYKAFFVAANHTIDDFKTVVKEVDLTIVP